MSSNPKVDFGVTFFSEGMIFVSLKYKSIFINDNSFRGGKMILLVKILTSIIEISVLILFTYFMIYSNIDL